MPVALADGAPHLPRVDLNDQQGMVAIGNSLMILEDPGHDLTIDDVRSAVHKDRFRASDREIPSFGFSPSAFWVRAHLMTRNTRETRWFLEYGYAPMQWIDVYLETADGQLQHQRGGMGLPFHERPYKHYKHVFELNLPTGSEAWLWVRIESQGSKTIPLKLYRTDIFNQSSMLGASALSLYAGIVFGLFCYNLFIYYGLREPAYLFYLGFVASFLVFALAINGVSQMILFPESPSIGSRLITLSIGFCELFGGLFAAAFLNTRVNSPVLHTFIIAGVYLSIAVIGLSLFASYHLSVIAGTVMAVLYPILGILTAILIVYKGNRYARYYLVSWFLLLSGVILYACRTFAILPTTFFTEYAILWGSAAEAILLSVALSARMRSMREEQQHAQARQLDVQQQLVESQARIVATQEEVLKNKHVALSVIQKYSVKLEAEVKARTAELVETQQRLVASEKIAALGVFTAGMAHEINNPANFISVGAQNTTAQIDEFRGFVKDLLAEEADPDISEAFEKRFRKLEQSAKTVSEGVTRIEHVVKQLRADHPEGEAGMQPADVVESLVSAWRVLSPTIKIPVSMTTQFETRVQVSCRIAELHQVFLALLTNAVHAIEDATAAKGPSYRGEIGLASTETADTVVITLADNGCGIPADKIDKIFDPFFTTKAVGRGAGLGLSMARDVLRQQGGSLAVTSAEGQGATFTITLSTRP